MFNFFYQSHRKGILTFSGSEDFEVVYDVDGYPSKECFRRFDNGQYKSNQEGIKTIPTRHPNILYSVIKGKKSWGLFVSEWSEGIGTGLFTKYEFLQIFEEYNIKIPDSLYKDFSNRCWDERFKREEEQEFDREFKIKLYKNQNN